MAGPDGAPEDRRGPRAARGGGDRDTLEEGGGVRIVSSFFKATVIGGLLFMVPLILMILVLQKGLGIVGKIVVPLAAKFPDHKFLGIGMTTILSVAVILILSFLFGLAARTRTGRRIRDWLEYTIMGKMPGYAIMKGMLQGATGLEREDDAAVALIRIEDAWQLGFVVEIHADGHRTVYVPGAPNPSSGAVFYMTEDRIRPVDIKAAAMVQAIRRLGMGSKDILKGKLAEPGPDRP
jgi:uncharacterized membrane protein